MEQAEAPEWEADDAIGTLCAQADLSDQIGIITGDRDLLQLVSDEQPIVRILYTVRGVSQLEEFNESAVEGKYGVLPNRYVDFAILRGDPSDGLPGVKGIGEKTASKLLAKYESLDALLADTASQTPKMAENLRNATDYIEKMKQIVPVQQDVETRIWQPDADAKLVDQLATAYGLSGPVARWRDVIQH